MIDRTSQSPFDEKMQPANCFIRDTTMRMRESLLGA